METDAIILGNRATLQGDVECQLLFQIPIFFKKSKPLFQHISDYYPETPQSFHLEKLRFMIKRYFLYAEESILVIWLKTVLRL